MKKLLFIMICLVFVVSSGFIELNQNQKDLSAPLGFYPYVTVENLPIFDPYTNAQLRISGGNNEFTPVVINIEHNIEPVQYHAYIPQNYYGVLIMRVTYQSYGCTYTGESSLTGFFGYGTSYDATIDSYIVGNCY